MTIVRVLDLASNNAEVHLEIKIVGVEPYQITRKLTDLNWLAAELAANNLGIIPPPFNPCHSLIKQDALGDEYIREYLKDAIQSYFDRLREHSLLEKNTLLSGFLSPDPWFAPYAQSKSSGSGFFKAMAQSVRSSKDSDAWFEDKRVTVTKSRASNEKCLKAVQKLQKSHRALISDLDALAVKAFDFAELYPSFGALNDLSRKLRQVSSQFEKISEIRTLFLCHSFNNNIKLGENAELTFDKRQKALTDYEDACKLTLKRTTNIEKLRNSAQVRLDTADSASAELHQAETAEKQKKEIFDKISENIITGEWDMFVRTLNENARDNISKLAEFESQSAKSLISEMKTLSDTANGFQIDINAADKIVAEVL